MTMSEIAPMEPTLALHLPEATSFDEWANLGRRLCAGARFMNWLIGDWLIAGAEKFGDRARNEANAIFRSDVERFDPIVKTCRRFPEHARHEALTFGHHLAVAGIEDHDQAEQLLMTAERDRLTTAALKAQVKVTHSQPRLMEDDDPEDTAMRHIAQAWNRAPKASRLAFLELAQESELGVIDL